jgi:hypothetical protein
MKERGWAEVRKRLAVRNQAVAGKGKAEGAEDEGGGD